MRMVEGKHDVPMLTDMVSPSCPSKDTYKLRLPNDLPPSHRGKSIRFNYYLVVGTQRAGRANGMQQSGQVFQLRFRVLNHVSGKQSEKTGLAISYS